MISFPDARISPLELCDARARARSGTGCLVCACCVPVAEGIWSLGRRAVGFLLPTSSAVLPMSLYVRPSTLLAVSASQ